VALDGSWSADADLRRTVDLSEWSMGIGTSSDASGQQLASVRGSHKDTHDRFRHAISGEAATDGSWSAEAGLSGLDVDNPWSLSAEAGRSALDPELDWSVTGKMSRALDDDGKTMVTGQQTVARDMAASRLQLDHALGADGSLSAWTERQRSAEGTVDSYGGSLQGSVLGGKDYVRGRGSSDGTWEAAVGVAGGTPEDDLSWFTEGFTARDKFGEQDTGLKAGFRLRF